MVIVSHCYILVVPDVCPQEYYVRDDLDGDTRELGREHRRESLPVRLFVGFEAARRGNLFYVGAGTRIIKGKLCAAVNKKFAVCPVRW